MILVIGAASSLGYEPRCLYVPLPEELIGSGLDGDASVYDRLHAALELAGRYEYKGK